MSALVSLSDVSKVYRNASVATWAVNQVNLHIQAGEFTAVVGRSGSGKSTLLSLIGTLDQPTSGEVEVCGQKVNRLKPKALADFRFNHIGFVFQQFYLIPSLTALENVVAPLMPRKVPFDKRKRASELLELVGLGDKAQRLPSQLSGGEQQRVSIARALVATPSLLLADEPTGNLDAATGETIFQLLSQINKEQNITILLVTHDRNLAERSQRVIEMGDGRIISDSGANQ